MASNTVGSLSAFKPKNENIEAYLERVQLYFEANGIEDDKRVAVLLTVIGSDIYALLRSLLAPVKPREKSFKELSDTLHHHFDPKPLVIAERFHFHRRNQASGESISEYVAELRRLATHCEFGDYLEQALRDRLFCGIRHKNTQKRLLSEANLTLTKATEIARSVEAAETQATQLKGTSSAPVMNVKSSKTNQGRNPEKHGICTRCGGRNHQAKDCRYKDVMCHKCNKQGHLARMCRSKKSSTTTPPDNIPSMPIGLRKLQQTATVMIAFFKYIASHQDHLQSICVYKTPHLTLKLTQVQPLQLFLKKLIESIFLPNPYKSHLYD